ncbi:MAG: methyltransferase [Candidatus Lokiarchaeota archaeon]|nr:methyltransferase [Candidatus Lokiarchaeota archaeon]
MISPTLSKKTLYKIRKLLPIEPNSKLFLPIIINPRNLENFLTLFPNQIVVSLPNYTVYSNCSKNQLVAKELLNNKIEFNMDFFGLISKPPLENIEGIIIILPINLSLDLLNYALHQLSKLLNHSCSILVISRNKKQNRTILNWLEDNQLEFSRVKSQEKFLFNIPEFKPSTIMQSDFKDIIFKIKYKKDFGEIELFSSSGVFSKDKVDDGTDFLLVTIINEKLIPENAEIIDYFAGVGVIGIVLSKFTSLKKVHFIESDVISLFLLKKNMIHNQISNTVVHELDGLLKPGIPPKTVDFIVANPPTHIKKDDFIKFLKISKTLLRDQGKLIIVINSIIPYERTLKEYFPNPSNIILFKKGNYKIIIS